MYRSRSFLLGMLLVTLEFGAFDAFSAPAVKLLGKKNVSNSASNISTVRAASPKQGVKIGSVRNTGVSVKPVSVNKIGNVGTTLDKTKTSSISSPQRLSVGKYIHTSGVNSGLIRPVSEVSAAAATAGDISVLTERVSDAEKTIETKQDKLTAGNGITISDDNVISVSKELADTLEDKVDLDNLVERYYTRDDVYTKEEINNLIQPIVNNNTNIHYSDTTTPSPDDIVIVDTFVPFGALLDKEEGDGN